MQDITYKWSEIVTFSPKQKLATQTADEFKFLLYGGAAYGGKSYWLRWYIIRKLIRWYQETKIEGIVAGLFCEDYPSLKDRHLSKMVYEFPSWLGTLKESGVYGLAFILKPEFGSGVLALRNLDDPAKYLSSEFALIAVDELTRNEKTTFDFLRSRLRWQGIDDTRFIAGTNPGQIGHNWVKDIWINNIFDPNEKESDQFKYVKATAYDNPHGSESYIKTLQSLPERQRRAYLEGDWDIFEGQYFTEFSREQHVVKPFVIPDTWAKFRSIDPSGRSGITSCHWYALDWNGDVWVYKEHYGTGLDSDQHADKIVQMSVGHDNLPEEYKYTCIDAAAFAKMGLPETIAEVYMRKGVDGLVPSAKNRMHGWDIVHQYLRWDEGTKPKLRIFETCPNLIKTLPSLTHDELHPEDVDSDGEDHAADELRYFLQTLREQKMPKPMTAVERKLMMLKEQEADMDFSYARKSELST